MSRLATCGAASATKPMGPAAAVTTAEAVTPTTTRSALRGSSGIPSAPAVWSPSSMIPREGASRPADTRSTAAAPSHIGSDPASIRVREPAPQNPTNMASSTRARVTRYALIAPNAAETASPTTIRRNPVVVRPESRCTTKAASSPPATAATAMAPCARAPNSRIPTTTAVCAPASKPMMSGDPRGLRVNDWKIPPPIPSRAPKTTAEAAAGRRHSRTTTRARDRPPRNTSNTCPGVKG